jgi:hypothetical protein
MSQYKVIQDVEAEDKLLGPLTLRQFIYAGITVICLYLCYLVTTRGLAIMLIFFLPVALVTGFFAFPWGRDQPTEIWALAKIRFMIKPRRRIWDQSGVKELVSITAPKHLDVDYTNGLSQNEVKSRLRALADTIDSRGWAIKNTNVNLYGQPALIMNEPTSDRLLLPNAMPQEVSSLDIQASDDILDEKNNPQAARMDNMITASSKAHRQKIVENLKKSPQELRAEDSKAATAAAALAQNGPGPAGTANRRQGNYWFLNQPSQSATIPDNMVTFNTQVVTPGMELGEAPAMQSPSEEEENLVHQLAEKKAELPTTAYYGHLHTIQPLSAQARQTPQPQTSQPAMQSAPPMTTPSQPAMPSPPPVSMPITDTPMPPIQTAPPVTPAQQAAILQLASNDDLNVATIAREAKRKSSSDEVVIKLH